MTEPFLGQKVTPCISCNTGKYGIPYTMYTSLTERGAVWSSGSGVLTHDPNIMGSIPIMDHLACDLGQVTLLRLPRPLK
jgi:hypothetical protein